jgi:ATP-binding cassette subfamily F protein 3
VLDAAVKATGLNRPQAQTLLGRFLFSGWETHEREVTALSGGERRRLVLALLVASGANLLVLDEPTNHLDLESREALEAALEAFPGTLLIVSHDRALLDAVPDRIVAIEDRSLRSYDGGWADLERERSAAAAAPPSPPAKERTPHQRSSAARSKRRSPSELELVEAQIAVAEARVSELEGKLADDWTNMDVLAAHRASRDELKELLGRWEALFEGAPPPSR